MSDVTPHLRAIAEGHPEALGTLADWCDEMGRADEARRLRKYQTHVGKGLAHISRRAARASAGEDVYAGNNSNWDCRRGEDALSHLRMEADEALRRMVSYVHKMFKKEWRQMQKDAAVADLGKNLRRIYGGGEAAT
jgi:hypothetical protein